MLALEQEKVPMCPSQAKRQLVTVLATATKQHPKPSCFAKVNEGAA